MALYEAASHSSACDPRERLLNAVKVAVLADCNLESAKYRFCGVSKIPHDRVAEEDVVHGTLLLWIDCYFKNRRCDLRYRYRPPEPGDDG